jgi:dihydropteroate synthase
LNYQTIFGLPEIKEDLKKLLIPLYKIEKKSIDCNGTSIYFDRTKVMGILNVTPDSFSDGNKYLDTRKAIDRAKQMINEGADFIDIGGESSRPGSKRISYEEEHKRVIPVIREIRKFSDIPVSVDTYKAKIAKEAILNGANIINDISALHFDSEMISVLQEFPNVPIILMHMKGSPEDMQKNPYYHDVIEEIMQFFQERIDFCVQNGIDKNRIIIDPGIGFGKRQEDNLQILKKLEEFHCFGVPILLGASRKSFINNIYESQPVERLEGTLATTAKAVLSDVEIIRVHDVLQNKRLIDTLSAIEES